MRNKVYKVTVSVNGSRILTFRYYSSFKLICCFEMLLSETFKLIAVPFRDKLIVE